MWVHACIYVCQGVCVNVCVCEDLVLCVGCEHPGRILDMMMVYWVRNPQGNLIHLVVSSHPSHPQKTSHHDHLQQLICTAEINNIGKLLILFHFQVFLYIYIMLTTLLLMCS